MPASSKDQPKQMSNNNLIIIMALISLLVVGASVLIGKALVTSIVRDTKVISAKSKADKQAKDDVAAAPNLVNAYNAMGSSANTLSDALPTSADEPSLLVALENMGNDSTLTVKSISSATASVGSSAAATGVPTSGSAAVAPTEYDFVVDYVGTYSALQKFLNDIEQSVRPMRVTGISMNGTGSSLTGEIDAATYWQDKAQLPFSTETIK